MRDRQVRSVPCGENLLIKIEKKNFARFVLIGLIVLLLLSAEV